MGCHLRRDECELRPLKIPSHNLQIIGGICMRDEATGLQHLCCTHHASTTQGRMDRKSSQIAKSACLSRDNFGRMHVSVHNGEPCLNQS